MTHTITFIPGDGTGPEIAEATRRVLEATGVDFDWDVQEAGIDVMEREGTPLPDRVVESIRRNNVAIKGPVTTPVGGGFRSVNVTMRKALNLYACVRPCKTYPGVRTRYDAVDIVIVRENTEDLYAGVEFERGSEWVPKLSELTVASGQGPLRDDAGVSLKTISELGTRRIVTYAFEYARNNGRRAVTVVHKANIMKYSDGLFLEVARDVAKQYSGIEFWDVIVDNLCMQLVQRPEQFDVLVLPNLYGDIISDLCAGLIGGLGVAPGANIGEKHAMFEAVHGSAPKYKGQNKVNPTAVLLGATLLLDHIGQGDVSKRIVNGVRKVIKEGKRVTYDLGGTAGTSEMADAIIDAMS